MHDSRVDGPGTLGVVERAKCYRPPAGLPAAACWSGPETGNYTWNPQDGGRRVTGQAFGGCPVAQDWTKRVFGLLTQEFVVRSPG